MNFEPARPLSLSTGEAVRSRITGEVLQAWILASDIVLIIATSVISGFVWDAGRAIQSSGEMAAFGAFAAFLVVAFLWLRRAYDFNVLHDAGRQIGRLVGAWVFAYFVIGWAAFLTKSSAELSRGAVSIEFVLGFAALALFHGLGARWLDRRFAADRVSLRRVALIVGANDVDVTDLRRRLGRNGIEVVGCATLAPATVKSTSFASACRVALRELRATMAATKIDAVYLFMPWVERRGIDQLRVIFGPLPVPILLFADRSTEALLSNREARLGGMRGFELQRAALGRTDRAAKRLLDIAVAGTALILLSPLFGLTSIAILLESGRPVLFRQKRKGFGALPFEILKFRSMTVQENGSVVTQATRNDARVTRLGRMLRKTSIDELPQLVNVLRGDMSIVGPRPHAIAHDDHYGKLIATYAFRQHVKPGITGWAQINGHRGETREVGQMSARVEHDLWYINHWSLWLDLKIIVLTAVRILMDDKAY